MGSPRKKRVSFDAEGEVHEFTFSTFRRQPFLQNEEFNRFFLENLDRARSAHGFLVWAYVLMPEHVHLLIPARKAQARNILSSIKQPFARRIITKLKKDDSPLLRKMISGAKRGSGPYSFWQVGGGYDRNVHGGKEYWSAIDYIHLNPVRRGLIDRPDDWPWSSARFYKGITPFEFEVDRCEEWIP